MWWPSYLYIIYMEEAPTIVIIYFSFLFFRENHFLSEFWGEVIISSFLFINFVLRSITLCSKIRKKCNLMKLHNYLKGYNWVPFFKRISLIGGFPKDFFSSKNVQNLVVHTLCYCTLFPFVWTRMHSCGMCVCLCMWQQFLMTFVEILACFVFSMDIKKERGANRFVFQLVRSRNVETV